MAREIKPNVNSESNLKSNSRTAPSGMEDHGKLRGNKQSARVSEVQVAGKVTSGSGELDSLLLGGFPEGYAIALVAPCSDERQKLIEDYLYAGPKNGHVSFYISSDPRMGKVLAEEYPSSMFLFVCNQRADIMVKDLPNVFKIKGTNNLTEIVIAVAKALRELDSSRTSLGRACIEIVSEVLLQHGAVVTRKWLNDLIQDLKSRGFSVLAVVNPTMHKLEETQAILSLFDGEILIVEENEKKTLQIARMYGQSHSENVLTLTGKERGLECEMCGKSIKGQPLVESVDGKNFCFDCKECAQIFKKLRSLYG